MEHSEKLPHSFFEETKLCHENEVRQTWRSWVEIFGLPPHNWSRKMIELLVSQVGDLLFSLDFATKIKYSLAYTGILIDLVSLDFVTNIKHSHEFQRLRWDHYTSSGHR